MVNIVKMTAQDKFGSAIAARAHDNRARSKIMRAGPAVAHEVSLSKIKLQEQVRARSKRVYD